MPYDIDSIRSDFPALQQRVHGDRPLVYLDSAATTLKPQCVIDAVSAYYAEYPANIHRGLHELSERATQEYEGARQKIADYIGAAAAEEIVVTSGTTGAMNLLAHSLGDSLGPDDEVLITHMEHHSNIVPWQLLAERRGCRLQVAPILDDGSLDLEGFAALLSERTRIVSLVHVSNSLGTVNPVAEIAKRAHAVGAVVIVDAAQSVSTQPVDVQAIDCDFLAFSGHKLFGPTGIGILYGKRERLEALPPFLGGGDMITSVTFEKTTYNRIPYRFEAGTPNIAGLIGLGRAVDYVQAIGLEAIAAHETDILSYATARLAEVEGARIIGTADPKVAVLSFVLDDVHPHDIGSIIDADGVAVRAGHHCTQPIMARFGVPATTRASFSIYSTRDDVDALINALVKVRKIFA